MPINTEKDIVDFIKSKNGVSSGDIFDFLSGEISKATIKRLLSKL
jgi:hypothetical protein